MTRRFLPAFILLGLAACSGEPQSVDSLAPFARGEMADFEPTLDGGPPPELALVGAAGEAQTLSALLGERATLVNLWATWCAPCIIEMPALNTLQADYGDEGLNVVIINLDDEAQKGLDFLEQRGLEALEFHHDPDLVAPSVYGTSSLPLTLIYDASGAEIGRTWGAPDWAGEDGRALIEAALSMADAEAP
jgi:thiol-disulfide isomerase/thioredoxin